MNKRIWGEVIFVLNTNSADKYLEKLKYAKKVFPAEYKRAKIFKDINTAIIFIHEHSLKQNLLLKKKYELFIIDIPDDNLSSDSSLVRTDSFVTIIHHHSREKTGR